MLLTGIEGDEVRLFDPYYCAKPFGDPTLQMVVDHPDAYNRIVPVSYLERDSFFICTSDIIQKSVREISPSTIF